MKNSVIHEKLVDDFLVERNRADFAHQKVLEEFSQM
jgi:hypothetical protein